MITCDEAKRIVEENIEGASVQSIYQYGKKYYLAVAASDAKDYGDPFYIVGIADGKYRFLNPMEDPRFFKAAMERGPLKIYDGSGGNNGTF